MAKLLWPIVALAALLIFNAIFTPHFMSMTMHDGRVFGSLVDVFYHAAPAAIAGIGMTLVIATGGIDLSVGAVMAIAGAVAALMVQNGYTSLFAILFGSLGVSLMCGLWNGLLVSIVRIQPIVATLLLMGAGRGIAQLMTDGQNLDFSHKGLSFIGRGYFLGLPFAVTLLIGMLLLTAILVRGTALGLFVEAVGDNETASRFAGINDRFVKVAVYAFTGFCAGIGGLIITANNGAADSNNTGMYLELDAILAVVIGGTALTGGRFYLLGTLIGALLMQTLTTTILTRGIPPEFTLVVKAVVVLAVCLLQSSVVQRQLAKLWERMRLGSAVRS